MLLTTAAYPFVKQRYGGNVKISDDLAVALTKWTLFSLKSGELKTAYPFPFTIEKNVLTADLSSLPADKLTEMEQAIAALQSESNPCHWILEYPYLHHPNANSIAIDRNHLIVTASEPEFLPQIAQSPCLIPKNISYLAAFSKTQFGYEANSKCIAGRPFLDSISPVAIDPVNPYLAFKLNEVDAFIIPEERFRQISSDDQIKIIPGPRFYLYLRSQNMSPEQMAALTASIHAKELSSAVLNDHAELYLVENTAPKSNALQSPVYMKIPEETPFALIGDRLKVQLESAGLNVRSDPPPNHAAILEFSIRTVQENDLDLFRYQLLKENISGPGGDTTWFEKWDELEAEGKIVPLMLYQSQIAIRKNLVDVVPGPGGIPDFSNAWIQPAP